jgi:transcriptional regulator of heat shock response
LLLESRRSGRTADAVEARLRRKTTAPLVDSLLSEASHVISQASKHVGFAIRPAHEAAVFDRVEFIPLGAARVLAW